MKTATIVSVVAATNYPPGHPLRRLNKLVSSEIFNLSKKISKILQELSTFIKQSQILVLEYHG